MKPRFNFSVCLVVLLGIIMASIPSEAYALTHHAKAHHTARNVRAKAALASKAKADLIVAQTHLSHLGFYTAKIDGKMGPKTRAALKAFQGQQHLLANGKLTPATAKALEIADKTVVIPAPDIVLPQNVGVESQVATLPPTQSDFYTKHQDFYGYYNQQYENPMLLGVPSVPSRFAHIEVHQKTDGAYKYYDISMNEEPLFSENEQASVIGISRTFSMQKEDAIIFTAYSPHDTLCAYKHYLLTISDHGKNLQEIANCTRGYQANLADDNLFIVFPEDGDARLVGNTWRYDGTSLERL